MRRRLVCLVLAILIGPAYAQQSDAVRANSVPRLDEAPVSESDARIEERLHSATARNARAIGSICDRCGVANGEEASMTEKHAHLRHKMGIGR